MQIIHLPNSGKRGSNTVKATTICCLSIIFAALLFSACSKGGSGHGTGGISFEIKMPSQVASLPQYKATDIPCIEYGIASVDAQVHDSQENIIATGGPWSCETGEGTISGIEEGAGYIVSISLKDSDGNVVLHGNSGSLQVVAGQVTDAGVIQLSSSNNPPVFDAIANQQVTELQPLSFTVNASDPDGNKLTYSATNLPAGATFDPASGFFYWIPGYDQGGSYTVRFQVTDDGTPPGSATMDVTITVGNVNQPPVLTFPLETQHFIPGLSNSLTVTATDPDGDTLTFDVADMPQDWWNSYLSGPVFDPSTRIFTWNDPTDLDEYRVLFRVTDNGTPRMSDYEWVKIQVYNSDVDYELMDSRYPVLAPIGNRQVAAGETLSFIVTATDPDGNPLTYNWPATISGKQAPTGFTFDSTGTHQFSWSPETPGNYWLRFSVRDPADHTGYGLSAYEDVVITVGSVNHPPVLTPIGRRSVRNNQPIAFIVTATDQDNDALTYSMSSPSVGAGLPSGVAFDAATQTFTWTPSLTVTPPVSYTIRFSAADDGSPSESDYEDVVITVLP